MASTRKKQPQATRPAKSRAGVGSTSPPPRKKPKPKVKIKKVKTLGPAKPQRLPGPRRADPDDLTPKERLFVQEWLIDKNGTRAYRAAGYTAKTEKVAGVEACRLLTKPRVAAAIEKALARLRQKLEVTAENVLEEYRRIAFADARDLYRPDGQLKQPGEWDDAVAATVASVEAGAGLTVKVRRWDKLQALDKLTKHLGICVERRVLEHQGEVLQRHQQEVDVLSLLSVEELRRLVNRLQQANLITLDAEVLDVPPVNVDRDGGGQSVPLGGHLGPSAPGPAAAAARLGNPQPAAGPGADLAAPGQSPGVAGAARERGPGHAAPH